MKQCLACSGLVPESLDACPNCAVQRSSGLKKVVAAAGLIALAGVASGCPMPVYGIACALPQVDGGSHGCVDECSTLLADGGVTDGGCYVREGEP